VLEAAGFPGERSLDSDEFQTQAKWHEALGELARLDRILPAFAFQRGVQILKGSAPMRSSSRKRRIRPIQVLGLLESAGVEFDHLWVTGLNRRGMAAEELANPFLPLAQQRKAGIPRRAPQTSLTLDRRITDGWKQAAGEVVFSHFTNEEDRDVLPSPLHRRPPPRRQSRFLPSRSCAT